MIGLNKGNKRIKNIVKENYIYDNFEKGRQQINRVGDTNDLEQDEVEFVKGKLPHAGWRNKMIREFGKRKGLQLGKSKNKDQMLEDLKKKGYGKGKGKPKKDKGKGNG